MLPPEGDLLVTLLLPDSGDAALRPSHRHPGTKMAAFEAFPDLIKTIAKE